MRAGQTINRWARVWGLTFFSLGIFHTFPAQAQQAAPTAKADPKHHHYKLIDLGTFGGPNAQYEQDPPEIIINKQGVVAASADTSTPDPYCIDSDCYVTHAFLWHDGIRTELDSLPGGYNSFAYSINADGRTVGGAQNGNIDPLTGYSEFVAVLWKHGRISTLGTLGGNQSVANAINDRGQVVGAALNAIPDPLSNAFSLPYLFVPAATQAHAFLWTEAEGMQDLGTLGGPDSTAAFVNQHGQVAGQSYTNATINPATSLPTQDPFFWEAGKMLDIGTLGGTFGISTGMNSRGQVIGQSNMAGDQTSHAFLWDKKEGLKDLGILPGYPFSQADWINDAGEIVGDSWAGTVNSAVASRAFLWKEGVMTDLGTVADDACSEARWINSRGQVVGFGSADCNHEDHAFLWENGGPIIDLSALVLPGSAVTLIEAIFINDRGEIAALGKLSNGDEHALVLLPCDEDHADVEGCDYSDKDMETERVQHAATLLANGEVLITGGINFDNAARLNSLATAELSNIGAQPETVTLSPQAMTFVCHSGVGPPPGCSLPEPVTVKNIGRAPVNVIGVTISPANGRSFAFFHTNHCPQVLPPGHSCTVTVWFEGSPGGRDIGVGKAKYTATLHVSDTASGSPQNVMLTGIATYN
jgi:probable HAF family extracellular repeat protein